MLSLLLNKNPWLSLGGVSHRLVVVVVSVCLEEGFGRGESICTHSVTVCVGCEFFPDYEREGN